MKRLDSFASAAGGLALSCCAVLCCAGLAHPLAHHRQAAAQRHSGRRQAVRSGTTSLLLVNCAPSRCRPVRPTLRTATPYLHLHLAGDPWPQFRSPPQTPSRAPCRSRQDPQRRRVPPALGASTNRYRIENPLRILRRLAPARSVPVRSFSPLTIAFRNSVVTFLSPSSRSFSRSYACRTPLTRVFERLPLHSFRPCRTHHSFEPLSSFTVTCQTTSIVPLRDTDPRTKVQKHDIVKPHPRLISTIQVH